MFVQHLSLLNFRSYPAVEIQLQPGVTVFLGHNGQGKTNLVEAVEYLANLSSHRVAQDHPLIRIGAEQAIIRARIQAGLDDPRAITLEVEINSGKANRTKINRSRMPRPRDILGVLKTVMFSPDDLAIVKGDPSDRRAFIDGLVTTRWPRMAGVRADYDKVLKQRNALLKAMGGVGSGEESELTLEVWTDKLAGLGGELLSARLDTLAELMPHASSAYRSIAPAKNEISADYRSSVDYPVEGDKFPSQHVFCEVLRQAMANQRDDEIRRGVSLVGPHRDDILLSIGELPAKGYASHGESWSLALAMKLGGFQLLRADNVEPVLVLDDVFAELDTARRERLADSIFEADQVLITAAVPDDIPKSLSGLRYRVHQGQVDLVPDDSQVGSDALTE